jgi:hypothetical protein
MSGRRAELVERLARGDIDTADVADEITRADRERTEDARAVREQKSTFRTAAQRAYRDAAAAISAPGDQWITECIRPAVDECVAQFTRTRDEGKRAALRERFEALHQHAHRGRSGGIIPSCRATIVEHTIEHPDRLHYWKLANATSVTTRASRHTGTVEIVLRHPVGAPPVTLDLLVEHADEWGTPTLHTAAEVITHADRIEREFEQAVDLAVDLARKRLNDRAQPAKRRRTA